MALVSIDYQATPQFMVQHYRFKSQQINGEEHNSKFALADGIFSIDAVEKSGHPSE
ncbi:hypothetical protein [Phyllobacterium sp. K27]